MRSPLPPIGKHVSKYRIIEKIGSGGMGEVYLARDDDLNRDVAVKIIQPSTANEDATKRFLREARAVAALNHPNIITIYEVGTHEDQPFIAMEYVRGQSLREKMSAGAVTMDEAVELTGQILEALDHAHTSGVVHRDIKPDNVLVGDDGRARLLDFGLAMMAGATQLTSEGVAVGTLRYMSPEQTSGRTADTRSDLFSVGSLLYELVTGRPAFDGEHPAALMYKIVNEPHEPLSRYSSQVDDALERIVARALEKDAERRYQSAADMRAELRSLEPSTSSAPALAAPLQRRRLWPLIAGVSAIALVAVAYFAFSSRQSSETPVAAADKLAVLYFDNLADNADNSRLGEMIPSLLVTSLTESQAIPVVSHQRIYDILKNMGHEGERRVDQETATQVAKRAGARLMMVGTVMQESPLVISTQVVDVASGDVVFARRVEATPDQEVFTVVDDIAHSLSSDMNLPEENVRPVVEVTSANPAALREFLVAMEAFQRYDFRTMKARLDAAVAIDSTFVLPYLYLTHPSIPTPQNEKNRVHRLGMRFLDHADRKTRFFMEVVDLLVERRGVSATDRLEAYLELFPDDDMALEMLAMLKSRQEQNAEAEQLLLRRLELDPSNRRSINNLVYIYDAMGNYDRALWAINRYIELAPDEHNPLDTRGDLYAKNGNLEAAIQSYRDALVVAPTFTSSLVKLGISHAFAMQWDSASVYFEKAELDSLPVYRAYARFCDATTLAFRGKLGEALRQTDAAIAACAADGYDGWYLSSLYAARGTILTHMGRYQDALSAFEKGLPNVRGSTRLIDATNANRIYMQALLKVGDDAAAREILTTAEAQVDSAVATTMMMRDALFGQFALENGDYQTAAKLLDRATPRRRGFYAAYQLAIALYGAGRVAEAVELYEELLAGYTETRFYNGVDAAMVHYRAGLAYEASGWNDRALEQYQTLLAIWQDSSEGLEAKADAERRVAALTTAN